MSAGDYRFELTSGTRVRSYLMHVPSSLRDGLSPVVINLHGGGGNAEQHRQSSRMDEAADRDGYIAVYPNGTGVLANRLLTWNAGNCCGYAEKQNVDDVGFISDLIADVGRRAQVDRQRIYIVGHSNGGMMAHRAGEALSGQVAAIASVAGAHVPVRLAGRVISVLHIHSVDDPRALYAGGLGPPFPLTTNQVLHPSVDSMINTWRTLDGCKGDPEASTPLRTGSHSATQIKFGNCLQGVEVVLWRLTGAGHGWPGGAPARESLVGPATDVIDANTEIWRFFSRHTLAMQ